MSCLLIFFIQSNRDSHSACGGGFFYQLFYSPERVKEGHPNSLWSYVRSYTGQLLKEGKHTID